MYFVNKKQTKKQIHLNINALEGWIKLFECMFICLELSEDV